MSKRRKKAKQAEDETTLFKLDREFHRLLAEGTNKLRVWQVIQRMDTHSNRLRKLSMDLKLNWDLLIEQHEAMVNAIKTNDRKGAESIMHAHLTLLKFDQSALRAEYPTYFYEQDN